jgi:predicted nicotinamide N-methyase
LRALLTSRYDLVTRRVHVRQTRFSLTTVRDTNTLLKRITPEQFRAEERLPFWAELWPSSVPLAEWMLGGNVTEGMRVLELGCGVGLAGIAAAAAGARVTLTDYEEDALLFARYNVMTNVALVHSAPPRFRQLDWRNPCGPEQWDTVCGADIIYDRAVFEPLLALLSRATAPRGVIVLTDPHRSPGDEFLTRAVAEGFTVETEETRARHGGRVTRGRLCRLRRAE